MKFNVKVVFVISDLSRKPKILVDKETRLLPSTELKNDETVAECLKRLLETHIDLNFEWMESFIIDNGYLRVKSDEIALIFSYQTPRIDLYKTSNSEWVNNAQLLEEKTKDIKRHPEEVEFIYRTGAS